MVRLQRSVGTAILALLGLAAAGSATAQQPEHEADALDANEAVDGEGRTSPDLSISANFTLVSEYRFRGVNLTNGDPALQGRLDLVHSSGFYAGAWASNLDETTVGYGAIELDLYAGWSGPVADGLTVDIGFIAYTYPDAGAGEFDYYEVYGSLAYSIGPVSSKVGVAYDPRQGGLAFGGLRRDNVYLFNDWAVGLSGIPVTLTAHLGYTDGALTFTQDAKSFDWRLSADWAITRNVTASAAYIDAQADLVAGQFNPTSGALVASISTSF